MAVAAIDLLNDPARLNTMRDDARKTAQKLFCASQIIPQYEKYYEQVLAQS
jgi:hypothetical protein